MPDPVIEILRAGDTGKPNPFTICIVANPVLEAPWKSERFVVDAMPTNPALFSQRCQYVVDCLFGRLAGQAEKLLADPLIAPYVRIVSLLADGLPAEDANALAAEDGTSSLLIPRRTRFLPFLVRYGLTADIAYVISQSAEHNRASAFFTTDNDASPGIAFTLDGPTLTHRFHCLIPGTIAIHATSSSLTALHEFGHALSSYTNGGIVDLYVDSPVDFNNLRGRPVPGAFRTYNGVAYQSDPVRDGLSYPPGWQSYHCELNAPAFPAVMDDYFLSGTVPEACEQDKITRQFLRDRLIAKIGR